MSPYFKLEPEVPGGWGDQTVADSSVHPPNVSALHLELDGWLGDDLLETFPCFVVTKRLAPLTNSKSDEFTDLCGDMQLPEFRWLQVDGRRGETDIATLPDGALAVSALVEGTRGPLTADFRSP